MGFMDKMKAVNGLSLGDVESPDFPCCALILDHGLLYITSTDMGGKIKYLINQSDVEIFELIGCGGEWAKYRIVFKNGKSAIITQDVMTRNQRRSRGVNVWISPVERFLKETVRKPISLNEETHSTQTVADFKPSNEQLEKPVNTEKIDEDEKVEEFFFEPAPEKKDLKKSFDYEIVVSKKEFTKEFVPEIKGLYSIKTTGSVGLKCCLYSCETGEMINYDCAGSGDNKNVIIKQKLMPNQKYYCVINSFTLKNKETASIHLLIDLIE